MAGNKNPWYSNPYVRSAIGAGIGYLASPKKKYKTTTAAQLDAATLPAMKQAANQRQAQLNATQGAQGGAGSSKAYENVMLRSQNAQNIGQQRALNVVAANNSQDAAYDNNYRNRMNRLNNALSMSAAGGNFGKGNHWVMKKGKRVLVDAQGNEVVK